MTDVSNIDSLRRAELTTALRVGGCSPFCRLRPPVKSYMGDSLVPCDDHKYHFHQWMNHVSLDDLQRAVDSILAAVVSPSSHNHRGVTAPEQ